MSRLAPAAQTWQDVAEITRSWGRVLDLGEAEPYRRNRQNPNLPRFVMVSYSGVDITLVGCRCSVGG